MKPVMDVGARPIFRPFKALRRHSSAYLFIAPFFLIYAVFNFYPLLYSFWLALCQWNGIGTPVFAGLANYWKLFRDALFWKAFSNNVILAAVGTVPCIVLALVLASLIDSDFVGSRLFGTVNRAMLFTPIVTSTVAIGIIFAVLYGTKFGLINSGLKVLGVQKNIEWLSDPFWMKVGLLILLVWRWLGYQIIFFTAGLKGIPRSFHEAAKIDGASGVQRFWYITLPVLRPITLFVFATSIIGMMQLFEEPLILSGMYTLGGAERSLLTMMIYLYKNAFSFNRLSYASAITWLMLAIVFLLTLANLRFFGQRERG